MRLGRYRQQDVMNLWDSMMFRRFFHIYPWNMVEYLHGDRDIMENNCRHRGADIACLILTGEGSLLREKKNYCAGTVCHTKNY